MLYEGAIRFLQQAIDAIEQGDPKLRYEKLARAGEILFALQSALDLSNGGTQAQHLHDFYSALDQRILSLHRSNDVMEAARIITELRNVRDAWDAIDRGDTP